MEDDVEEQEHKEQGGGGGVKDSTTTTSKIKSIFATDVMKEGFEIQAITNIQQEIQLLQAGNILSLLWLKYIVIENKQIKIQIKESWHILPSPLY